jgi:hypothetical protein
MQRIIVDNHQGPFPQPPRVIPAEILGIVTFPLKSPE